MSVSVKKREKMRRRSRRKNGKLVESRTEVRDEREIEREEEKREGNEKKRMKWESVKLAGFFTLRATPSTYWPSPVNARPRKKSTAAASLSTAPKSMKETKAVAWLTKTKTYGILFESLE